jgi:hypothetical protein
VLEACTVPDALGTFRSLFIIPPQSLTREAAAKNITATNCGQPVRDRTGELVAISIAMVSTYAVFVIMRLGYKLFANMPFGMDDWFVAASAVATLPSIFLNIYGTTANGLGKDIWTLSPENITNSMKYFWVLIILYFMETALTKLSIICFYLRIFTATRIQRILWATFIVTGAWGAVFVIVAIFQCRPISLFWTHWDGLHQGHCADANAIGWSNAGMNIAFDLWILAIPLSQLPRLKLHWKKKAGVAVMFCLGTL